MVKDFYVVSMRSVLMMQAKAGEKIRIKKHVKGDKEGGGKEKKEREREKCKGVKVMREVALWVGRVGFQSME